MPGLHLGREDGATFDSAPTGMTVAGGRERTAGELSELLARAGFRLDTVIDTPSPRRIVQALSV